MIKTQTNGLNIHTKLSPATIWNKNEDFVLFHLTRVLVQLA